MFEQLTLFPTTNAISSQASADGATRFGSQDGPTIGPCGPAPARASRSASRAKAPESMTPDTSGLSSLGSSASAALQLATASRLRQALAGLGSPLYALTWKAWDMPSGPPICALRASGRRTFDSGCSGSGWPTPIASAFEARDVSRMLERRAELQRKYGNNGFGMTLGQAVLALCGWSSPIVNDATGWATPEASDWNMEARAETVLRRTGQGRQISTAMQAKLTGPYASGLRAPTGQAGRLNPELPRWLMGYPAAWGLAAAEASPAGQPPNCAVASSEATETRSSRKSRRSS
jgi:hypothetical protein